MNSILSKLIRKDLYESIPYDDLISRQKFTLFRIYSYTSFLASFSTALQISFNFENNNAVEIILFGLAFVLIGNLFLVNRHERLPVAYSISVLTGFLVLHIQAYTAGGLMNTGTMYMCVIIMTAFMLLGPRAGKWFTGLAILNVIYFYFAGEYTDWTSYALFQDDLSLIHQDALTTFILALFLVAAQSNYLHSGKNVIIQRITEQKDELQRKNRQLSAYTEHLEKTNRELDKFAFIVSHDLKAPLRAIGNLTGWIEEDAGDTMNREVRANFDLIKQRVRRMEDLINAILDYSRADRTAGDETEVNTAELVRESLDFIGIPDNAVVHIAPGMPVLTTDKTRLNQVFSNLLGNAIRYCDKPQVQIQVNARESEGGWEFSVLDNGPGIDPQYHEKIFVIFQTLQRRDEVESTGVGLAIVKKIIEDQGGKIWVESKPGEGANFKFFWPRERKNKDSDLHVAA